MPSLFQNTSYLCLAENPRVLYCVQGGIQMIYCVRGGIQMIYCEVNKTRRHTFPKNIIEIIECRNAFFL